MNLNFKNSKLKIAICLLVAISILEAVGLIKLYEDNLYLSGSRSRCWGNYDKSIGNHKYTVKIHNCGKDLNNVVLKYKTLSHKLIKIGKLEALDIDIKDSIRKKGNNEAHIATVDINDMASPIFFEITGIYNDGSLFKDSVSGFDIQHEGEVLDVYTDKKREGLLY